MLIHNSKWSIVKDRLQEIDQFLTFTHPESRIMAILRIVLDVIMLTTAIAACSLFLFASVVIM